jgi:transcriptional regulator with XRE-family HTH domain
MDKVALLKSKRVAKGIDQREMAQRLGMAISSYSFKENNIDQFRVAEARRVSEVLNLTHDEERMIFFDITEETD